jgi:hypothetical protein
MAMTPDRPSSMAVAEFTTNSDSESALMATVVLAAIHCAYGESSGNYGQHYGIDGIVALVVVEDDAEDEIEKPRNSGNQYNRIDHPWFHAHKPDDTAQAGGAGGSTSTVTRSRASATSTACVTAANTSDVGPPVPSAFTSACTSATAAASAATA